MGGRYCAINSPLGSRWGQKSLDLRSRDFCPHLEPCGELIVQYRPPMSFRYKDPPCVIPIPTTHPVPPYIPKTHPVVPPIPTIPPVPPPIPTTHILLLHTYNSHYAIMHTCNHPVLPPILAIHLMPPIIP